MRAIARFIFTIITWPILRAMESDRRARSAGEGFVGYDDNDPGVDVDVQS